MQTSHLGTKMKVSTGQNCRESHLSSPFPLFSLYDAQLELHLTNSLFASRSDKYSSSAARPVIPKRGDKDFEPSVQGGSGLQKHVLDRARNAMFDALRAGRNTSRFVPARAVNA